MKREYQCPRTESISCITSHILAASTGGTRNSTQRAECATPENRNAQWGNLWDK